MIDEKKLIEDIVNTPSECLDSYSVSSVQNGIQYGCATRQNEIIDIINKQPQADKWIPVEERLPSEEEYLEHDGRFIVTDGNRVYQSCYDIYSRVFKTIVLLLPLYKYEHDKCVIAWQPLPRPYKKEGVENDE